MKTPTTVSAKNLPQDLSVEFKSSSFFSRNSPNARLPTPSEVVAQQDIQHPKYKGTSTYLPVLFEDLGLLVKYGKDPHVTVAEGQCLWALRQFLPQVPVPEIYGWTKEGPLIFLYMELIPGVTLGRRWDTLSQTEKIGVCHQLKQMIADLHLMRQEPSDPFVGDINRGPLGDIVFTNGVMPRAGPFASVPEFHNWISQMVKRPALIHMPGVALSEIPDPYREMVPDDSPITFTHADLNPVNIMVSEDSPCRVLAIIDWQQSGWYPAYWEYCKAEYTVEYGGEWQAEYLHRFLKELGGVEGFDSYARAYGH